MESDEADVDQYDREDVDWDGQYSSGRKRRPEREGVVIDMDYYNRKLRKARYETNEEINQRMLSVEMAVKEALLSRGEANFTDQEFPPNDKSLYVDPGNPPIKLQVRFTMLHFCLTNHNLILIGVPWLTRLLVSGSDQLI